MDFSTRTIQPATSLLEKWNFASCGTSCVRLSNPALPPTACGPACEPVTYRGTLHALRTIAATEGLLTLWRGTSVALIMAIPMVGVYLPLYDHLLEEFQLKGMGGYTPLLAGTLARTAAVTCTAPLELMRTRAQAVRSVPVAAVAAAPAARLPPVSMLQLVAAGGPGTSSRLKALGRMWTGVGATLARDVPFSGMYWALVEPIRASLLPPTPPSEWDVMNANVTAGRCRVRWQPSSPPR